jgi:hypothetical protein
VRPSNLHRWFVIVLFAGRLMLGESAMASMQSYAHTSDLQSGSVHHCHDSQTTGSCETHGCDCPGMHSPAMNFAVEVVVPRVACENVGEVTTPRGAIVRPDDFLRPPIA